MKKVVYVTLAVLSLSVGASLGMGGAVAQSTSQAAPQPSSSEGNQIETMAGGEGWG